MRYAIFSDVHSNLEALEKVLDAYKAEAIDKYLFAGDLVGYGADPCECIRRVKEIVKISVAGNHDWASVGLFDTAYFNHNAFIAINWTKGKLSLSDRSYLESFNLVFKNKDLILVHGTLNNPEEFNYLTDRYLAEESFRIMETNVCFVGHSHIAGVFIRDKDGRIVYQNGSEISIENGKKYIINVGSVGQPRDQDPRASYCIYDTEKNSLEIRRILYSVERARKKILSAGLPEFLGNRLLAGI